MTSVWSKCELYRSEAAAILSAYVDSIDRNNLIPGPVLDNLQKSGYFNLNHMTLEDFLCRVRAFAYCSPGVAHSLLVHATAWIASGKPELKGILALSITEPGGGTDIKASLKTRAESFEGKYFISGEKIFTSNAPYAEVFIVLANGPQGPTLFKVNKSNNIKISVLDLTGLRGTGASRVIYNRVEAEPAGKPGKGLKEALTGINIGRIGYASIALGIADRSLKIIAEISESKTIFGKKLSEYQGLKWKIAEIYTKILMLESLILRASQSGTWLVDPVIASAAKIEGARIAQNAAWLAQEISGGRGFIRWNTIERLTRDARVLDIGEGSREVLLDFLGSKALKAYSI